MLAVKIIKTTGEESALDEAAFEAFQASLQGPLLRSGDEGYDAARSIWNGLIDKRPALIARCTGVADVIETVKFAHANNLVVSVKGGGHHVSGSAVCDGGLMIDLSPMKGIYVNPQVYTARAQPGVTWGELDRETQLFGLAVPGGIASIVGIAGFTLGGGIGWLTRKHGLTCDNLLSVDIITADGRLLTANEYENTDLFWGVRGGGGNFGIVTSFEYRLHPVGPMVLAGMVLHSIDKAADFLRFYRDFAVTTPDELMTIPLIRFAPPAPFIPEPLRNKLVVGVAVCYIGPIEDGEQAVQPLKDFGPPAAYLIGPKLFTTFQAMFDAGAPSGNMYYQKTECLTGLSDEAIETFIAHAVQMTSPLSLASFYQLGGAVHGVGQDETAFSHREAAFVMNIQSAWVDPNESNRHVQWTHDFWKAMRPFSTGGVYVNFISADEGENRVRAAYDETTYERLVALKNRYDPANLFRLNQNITPMG